MIVRDTIWYGKDGVVSAVHRTTVDEGAEVHQEINLSSVAADLRVNGYVALKKKNEELEKELDIVRRKLDTAGIKHP